MSQWTLGLMTDHVASKLQLKAAGAFSTEQIPKDLNRAAAFAHAFHEWNCLIKSGTATIAIGDSQLVAPKRFASIIQTFNTEDESQKSEGYLPRHSYDVSEKYQFPIDVPCLRQPSAATLVSIKSSSASDTGRSVLIEGFLNGEPQSEVLTSDGTTLVNSSLQFDSFAAFSKDKVNSTNGNFTVCSPDELTTYAIISAWEASPRYTAYRLPAVATAASTVYFIGKERFKPMLNKLSPPFMDGIAYALIDGAVSLANQEQNQTSSEDILAQTMAASLNDVIAKTEQSTLGRKIVRG